MDERGLNPNSLAAATNNKTTQPQIYRFLNGLVKEPKRSTWEPVASFFRVPVDAFFDARAAERALAERLSAQTAWTPAQPAPEGVIVSTVAQNVIPLRRDDAPIQVEWERILKDPLKREFQTTMPDASMEPDIPRGAGIIFVTDLQPAPGDWVLIRDRDGNAFVRELRQVKPGRWQAHALNPAFLPMDSEGDGLEVLAVFDGLRGRKARV